MSKRTVRDIKKAWADASIIKAASLMGRKGGLKRRDMPPAERRRIAQMGGIARQEKARIEKERLNG